MHGCIRKPYESSADFFNFDVVQLHGALLKQSRLGVKRVDSFP